jgi:hypothetical protein
MDALLRNIYALVFALMTVLAFTIYKICEIFDIHYPSGVTQVLVVLLFLFVWYRFGRRISFPPGYGKLLAVMALFLAVALPFSKGHAGVYGLGTAFTFLFTIVFLLAYNTALEAEQVVDFLKASYIVIPLLAVPTVLEVFVNQVAFRDAPTLFREPGAFAGILIYGVILCLTLYTILKNNNYLIMSFLLSLVVAISTYKKSIVTLSLAWLSYLLREKSWVRKMAYLYLFIVAGAVGYLVVGQAIQRDFVHVADMLSSRSQVVPRVLLLQTGFTIAVRQFPFGSGLGTFASIPSIHSGYSDVYYQYGFNKVWDMSPAAESNGQMALLDCYWAHILGELGFIGSTIFLLIWFYPVARTYSLTRQRPFASSLENGLRYFIYTITAIMTIDGFAYYYAENPAFIIIHAGLVGFALRLLELIVRTDDNPVETVEPVPSFRLSSL